jgi:hypothetical protein
MFVQTPARSKSTKPNLRLIDPSARGGSADSYFRGKLKTGGGNGTRSGNITAKTAAKVKVGGNGYRHGGNGIKANRRRNESAPKLRKKGPSAGKLILWSLIIGVLGYGYITHVFATQKLYTEVNDLRRQYENVQANHAAGALTFDRMTGPAEVYRRARDLGFIDPGPADHVIIID